MNRLCLLPLVWLASFSALAEDLPELPADDVPAIASEPPPLAARQRDWRARRAQPLQAGVPELAAAVLPYAALAHEVYCNEVVNADPADAECRRESGTHRFGWTFLQQYPTPDLPMKGSARGLQFNVYYADDGPTQPVRMGVAFRGTDFSSWTDWHSNLRWFLPGRDQYDVVAEIATTVIERSQRAIAARLGREVDGWHIVATGHSLGGGLAQLFAYKSEQVRGAVVFDPSPVTGYHSCVSDDEVNCNVPIWRVYERGEVLAYLRGFTRLFYPLSENITELEFDLLGGNGVANHSMSRFYRQLETEVQRRPVPPERLARLFDPRWDCSCSRDRRQALWTKAQAACEALAAPPPGAERVAGGAPPM